MEQIAGGRYDIKSEAQKRIDQAVAVTSGGVCIAAASTFYPPLIWLTVPGIIYGSIPIYLKAYQATVKEKRASVYLLDALLTTGALIGQYFTVAVVGAWMSTLAAKLLIESEHNTRTNLSNLFGEQPRSVWILTDDEVELEIPFEALQLGDTIIVSAGQMIPIDGIIENGFAVIDQHKLTGESQPIEKGAGDSVLASTVVLAGRLLIKVEKTGSETVAMQIGEILNQTSHFKDSMRSKAEVLVDYSVLPTLGLFAFSWPVLGSSGALAVLTNKFGSKMRALGPASMLVFLNLASQDGILVKDGRSLELLNEVDTIVFDKTGTLTLEQPTVVKIHTSNGASEEDILRYAAAAEYGQAHPIAKAILTAANERELEWPKIEDARYEIGYGIQVTLSDRVIRVGSNKFMVMEEITIPPEISQVQEDCHEQGHSCVCVAFDDQLVGAIELHATIRPEAKEVIDRLRTRNISMYIISGDHEPPTKRLAEALGIEHYFANTLPENKAELVEELQKEGKSICFVGDGINDTIALKKANVSVSLSGATTIAMDTAQVVMMDGTLNKLEKAFDIARDFNVNMMNNFYISTIPTAVGLTGIFFLHWGIFPVMMLSQGSLFVGIGNTMLPLFTHYTKDDGHNGQK
ncbi:MAG: heavy metal translocating P-type ATPase [Ardenticatenaceae bacterium]